MSRFNQQHMRNIQCIFEEKTGVDLNPAHHYRPASRRKACAAVLAAVFGLLLASCAYVLFTPRNGDALSLSGKYDKGVVSVMVVNGSEKNLAFQEQVKLMSWEDGEIPPAGGKVRFRNTVFPSHSSGIMTIDLREAYPVESLESTYGPNGLYLILTNNDFEFGHDWICSLQMTAPETNTESSPETEATGTEPVAALPVQNGIPESLRFYFEDHYLDQIPAFNPANGNYMAAVQKLLSKQNGIQVHSLDPLLVAEDPEKGVIFDPGIPEENQYQLVTQHHLSLDSFNRMVGSVFTGDGMDTALMLGVPIPQYQGQSDGGIGDFKLLYFFTFLTSEIRQEGAYAFVYGHILTFSDMEENLVYQDELYTVYDMTDLFYTDLDAYIDAFLSAYGGQVYCDEQVRQRIHNIYHYYRDREKLGFRYVVDPSFGYQATPMVPGPAQ